ncbi:MAG: response regulator [Deltaproteobacteria bacterium]|nr:response regulator [Deltaproteobacteria bacterium]
MASESYLDGIKVLIVDDEVDILETLEDLLIMCNVVTASTFDEAKDLLESQPFDIAILDIMGVEGYELLDIANKQGITVVMLTAHALSPEDTMKSHKGGAASYIPKEEMANITTYLSDVLEAKEKGKDPWWRWFERFGDFFSNAFGPRWYEKDKSYWDRYMDPRA